MGRKSKEEIQRQAHIKAVNKYDSKTYKKITFRFHTEKNKDIIEYLNKQDNKNKYIINLITEDMRKHESD